MPVKSGAIPAEAIPWISEAIEALIKSGLINKIKADKAIDAVRKARSSLLYLV